MNPFLDSQAQQRNTPRGCGFAGAPKTLFAASKPIEIA
jgi:hypothetical protein